MNRTKKLERIAEFFDSFSQESVNQLKALYTPDAYFRDPFQEVRGVVELERIFGHMYVTLIEPGFKIIDTIEQGDEAFLTWDFTFRFKRFSPKETRTIRGSSHLRFAADGKVSYHRDYWDAADMYAMLPVIGRVMKILKSKASE
jgi:steroid Delta-isomerase